MRTHGLNARRRSILVAQVVTMAIYHARRKRGVKFSPAILSASKTMAKSFKKYEYTR